VTVLQVRNEFAKRNDSQHSSDLYPRAAWLVSLPRETTSNIFALSARLTKPLRTRFRSSPHPNFATIFDGEHFKIVRNSRNLLSLGDHAGSRSCRSTCFQSQTESQLFLNQPSLPSRNRLTPACMRNGISQLQTQRVAAECGRAARCS
jgi:hypothetical protein